MIFINRQLQSFTREEDHLQRLKSSKYTMSKSKQPSTALIKIAILLQLEICQYPLDSARVTYKFLVNISFVF